MGIEEITATILSRLTSLLSRKAWVLVLVVGGAVPLGLGQSRAPGMSTDAARLTRSDKSFLRNAAEENEAAIELGQVAEQKGFSARARNFARTLVAQRSRAQQELLAVAHTFGMALPKQLSRRDRKAKQQLEKHSGAELDRLFLSRMALDLDRQYGSYEDTAMSTQNPAVKRYIESLLPDVKHQDQVAKAIAPGEGAGSSNDQ
jgi:putative membrane protein